MTSEDLGSFVFVEGMLSEEGLLDAGDWELDRAILGGLPRAPEV